MPKALAQSSEEAHRKSVGFTVADVAAFLQDALGQRLTAHIAGISDAKAVARWANGERTPRAESEQRLRAAFQVFHMLQDAESPHTARAWFIGLNPQLDDDAPADALRDGRLKDVVVAARAYIAGG